MVKNFCVIVLVFIRTRKKLLKNYKIPSHKIGLFVIEHIEDSNESAIAYSNK